MSKLRKERAGREVKDTEQRDCVIKAGSRTRGKQGLQQKERAGKRRGSTPFRCPSGNKLGVLEGMGMGAWGSLLVGPKEGADCMEHWVLYANNESWNNASKTNDVFYGD